MAAQLAVDEALARRLQAEEDGRLFSAIGHGGSSEGQRNEMSPLVQHRAIDVIGQRGQCVSSFTHSFVALTLFFCLVFYLDLFIFLYLLVVPKLIKMCSLNLKFPFFSQNVRYKTYNFTGKWQQP